MQSELDMQSRGWAHRGHGGQTKGADPTFTPTWILLIKSSNGPRHPGRH